MTQRTSGYKRVRQMRGVGRIKSSLEMPREYEPLREGVQGKLLLHSFPVHQPDHHHLVCSRVQQIYHLPFSPISRAQLLFRNILRIPDAKCSSLASHRSPVACSIHHNGGAAAVDDLMQDALGGSAAVAGKNRALAVHGFDGHLDPLLSRYSFA
eukprot:649435-Hanusia_phi.AAC.2